MGQIHSRTSQERKDQGVFLTRHKLQIDQFRERCLYRRDCFQQRIWNALDEDFAHSVVLLERSN